MYDWCKYSDTDASELGGTMTRMSVGARSVKGKRRELSKAKRTSETRSKDPVEHEVDRSHVADGHESLGQDVGALVERVEAGWRGQWLVV